MLLVRPAKAGSTIADAAVMIGFTVPDNAMACVPMPLKPATKAFGDDCASMSLSAARRALPAALLAKPESPKLPEVGTDSALVAAPLVDIAEPPSDVTT